MKKEAPHSVKSKLIGSVKDLTANKATRKKVDESYFKEIKGKEHWVVYLMMQAFDEMETEFYSRIEALEERQNKLNVQMLGALKDEREALIEMKKYVENNTKKSKAAMESLMNERLTAIDSEMKKSIEVLSENSIKPALSEMGEKIDSVADYIEAIKTNNEDSYKILSHNQESITKLYRKLEEMGEDIAALDERIGIEISRIPGMGDSVEVMKGLESSVKSIKSISADLEGMKNAVKQMSKIKDLAHVSEEIQRMKDDVSKALEGLDVKDQVEDLTKKLESLDMGALSKSMKELEDLGKMASQIDEIKRRLSSIEELGDFQAQIDDLQKRMMSVKEIEEEMKKDMDVLRRLVGEFEEMTSVTEMLGELDGKVKRIEAYGHKLDALDIDAIQSRQGISPELQQKLSALSEIKGSDMEPVKKEVEAMKSQVADIEKKVDMILKSTNRHLDIMEKNLKAEIEALKGG